MMKNLPPKETTIVSVLRWHNSTQNVIRYPRQKFRLCAGTEVNRESV